MTKPRYYFEHAFSEKCYPKEYFEDEADSDGKVELYEALPDKANGVFWCKAQEFCGDDSKETCGKECPDYEPRNGKNGCCKHYTTKFYVHGEKVTVTI